MSLEVFVMTDEKSCIARIKPDEKGDLFIPRIGDELSFPSLSPKYQVKKVSLNYDHVSIFSEKDNLKLIGVFVYVDKF